MTLAMGVLERLRRAGRDLFAAGLVTYTGGNLSHRVGDGLVITRHGARLGDLAPGDFVAATLTDSLADASMDLAVHQAIYRRTDAIAIVHAHPVHAIALSLLGESVEPVDAEGRLYLGRVPVVGTEVQAVLVPLAEAIAEALVERPIAIARGHGSFARGARLEEALQLTFAVEASCQILAVVKLTSGGA